MNISAIILAGGKSSRMKYNKEYIKINNRYLVHILIDTLSILFHEIIVVSDNINHYKEFNVKVVSDILKGSTPIIGLHSGLVNSTNNYNYVIACDMPNINLEYIKYLQSIIIDKEAYVTKQNSFIEPFNAIYSKSIIPTIDAFISKENYGFQRLVKSLNTHYITESKASQYNTDGNMFLNINSETDLLDRNNEFAPITKTFEITKYSNEEEFIKEDQVITEYPLKLYINKDFYSLIMITPKDIEFMIIGYLHSNMLISSIEDIKSFGIDLQHKRCDIELDSINDNINHKVDVISSACTSNPLALDDSLLPKTDKNNRYDLNDILTNISGFNKESILFKETGGVHSVSLFTNGKSLLFEDIGRHNAVDKACGYILKNNLKKEKNYLLTSGRISSDIVLKAALINIELIVSRSAPTALAINLAKKLNITVAGFARGNKLNIYSHKERLS